MAPKDYVSRAKPSQKVATKKPVPWLPVIIAAAIIIGFVLFLFTINDKSKTLQNGQVTPSPHQEEALPEMKESKWTFLKELEDKEVTVDLPEKQLAEREAPTYVMQCGSFRNTAQAEEMKAKIAFAGLEASVKRSDGDNGIWHRVVLGPYDKKRQAEKHRHRIKELGILTCQIW